MSTAAPLEVMYTVDVESWPRCANWKKDNLAGDLARDVYGKTPDGEFGLRYQVEFLKERGLKGVFFIEALFACEVGREALAEMVELVQDGGSEVQLHIHTEWFEKMDKPFLDKRAYNIRELSLDEQTLVVRRGLENLQAAGADNVIAYRAGNFGANFQTLQALVANGIQYDSSYNFAYLDKGCGLRLPDILVQPAPLEGLMEYPVTCFRDYPGHYRPAQLCAVSASEMQAAMVEAHRQDWQSFVIVSHSFEMLRDRKGPTPYAKADWSVIGRFEALCEFLAANKSNFKTVGFSDVSEPGVQGKAPLHPPIVQSSARTAGRMFSQALRRLPSDKEEIARRFLGRIGLKNL